MPLKDHEARRAYLARYQQKNHDKLAKQSADRRADPERAEAARQRAKKWYEDNKERAAKAQRTYRAEHKEQVAATFKAWKKANKKRMRELNAQSSKRRREHINERRRKYRAANRAKISQENAKYYERTKEQRQVYSREWWHKNKTKAVMYSNTRRAREANVGGKYTAEDYLKLWFHYEGKCAVIECDKPPEYCLDHVMPLSRGGTNDFANLQILCKSHNSQKKNRTNEEWVATFNVRLRDIPPLTALPSLQAPASILH